MRIFHMTSLGESSIKMGKADSPINPETTVSYGVFACSLGDSSFTARFDQLSEADCTRKPHSQ